MRRRFGASQERAALEEVACGAVLPVAWRKPPDWLPATFHSLAYRDFQYLWLAQLSHAGALWMEMVARPLLVLEITGGSAAQLGLVMAVRALPALPMGLMAGVMADIFNRRSILLVTKATVLLMSFAFALLILTGRIELWHIYAFTLARGATMSFDQPARRALIPTVVPPHLVTNAVALSSGVMQVTRLFGPAVAGLLVAWVGFGGVFLIAAFFYVGAVLFTALMHPADHARAGYQGARAAGRDVTDGLRFAWNSVSVRGILILALVYFVFGMAFTQVFAPLFAEQVLDIGPAGFGLMMAATAAGGLLGTLTLASLNPRAKRGMMMLGMMAMVGIALILFSLSTYLPWVLLSFGLIALLGVAQSFFFPLTNAVLLDTTPEGLRGRVIALLAMDRAVVSGGAAVAGFMAAGLGTQTAQILFGAACVFTALAMLVFYSPVRRID